MHNPEAISKEVITVLSKILDGETGADLERVIIAGSSVRPTLPPELTRPGRFDKEFQIPLPNQEERHRILREITHGTKFSDEIDFNEIANKTRGYTPADLIQLVKTAARIAIRREFPQHTMYDSEEEENPIIKLSSNDLQESISAIIPTVYKEFGLLQPDIKWDDIAGQYQLKALLQELVIEPITNKEYFKKAGVSTINGIVLYGPPGNGKTSLAKAIASAISAHFLYINSSELIGDTGKEISQLFRIANDVEPTVLFFDEIDSLIPNRDNADSSAIARVNEFLSNLDGAGNSEETLVIAATNYLDRLDPAAIRTGRMELKLFVPPPDDVSRKEAFEKLLQRVNVNIEVNFDYLVKITEPTEIGMYSFSDLVSIVRESGSIAAKESIEMGLSPDEITIRNQHFQEVVKKITPSLVDYNENDYKAIR